MSAKNVFLSFRFSDGSKYKEELVSLFSGDEDTVDFSEDKDRSHMSDDTIRQFLYSKLKRSSVTIILLTPKAISYRTDSLGNINDWIYDEVRYSLEDRFSNRTNGIVAVYTPEAKPYLMTETIHTCGFCKAQTTISSIIPRHNLVYRNMMNIKPEYKNHKCIDVFDGDWDSYCSLVAYNKFRENYVKYIDIALRKREMICHYKLCKRL